MKQELAVPHAARRTRVVSTVKDSPRTDTANGASIGLKARPKSTSQDASSTKLAERSLQFNKRRPDTDGLGAPKVVKQFARLKRREEGVDGKTKELESRLCESERLVRELQKEVTVLKTAIEKLQVRNVELESQNRKLEQDLDAPEAKIKRMEKIDQVGLDGKSKFRDLLELVQEKSNNPTETEVKGNSICKNQPLAMGPATRAVEVRPNAMIKMPVPTLTPSKGASHGPTPPPPPPPPPPPHNASGRATVSKASALVQLYHSLTKQEGKQGSTSNGGSPNSISSIVHSDIVGELQHRSAHLVAIKADVETKGQLIKHLIEKVQLSSFTSMEDVLNFVDWLDGELSTLVDERAVLKHFDWPEKRADALREAAVEFRDLKQLEAQVCSFKDDSSLPCEATLKKISNLLDKLERCVDRLLKLRNANMILYMECKIPTDWLLDCGMVNKMKQISVKLARLYLSRVSMELELFQPSERQSTQEALLFQGVKFAYRAHQFAGGLDSELMITIEELKKKVESQSRGSNGKLVQYWK